MAQLCYNIKLNGKYCRNYKCKNKVTCRIHDDDDNDNNNNHFNYKILTMISMLLTCMFIYQIEYHNLIENELNEFYSYSYINYIDFSDVQFDKKFFENMWYKLINFN